MALDMQNSIVALYEGGIQPGKIPFDLLDSPDWQHSGEIFGPTPPAWAESVRGLGDRWPTEVFPAIQRERAAIGNAGFTNGRTVDVVATGAGKLLVPSEYALYRALNSLRGAEPFEPAREGAQFGHYPALATQVNVVVLEGDQPGGTRKVVWSTRGTGGQKVDRFEGARQVGVAGKLKGSAVSEWRENIQSPNVPDGFPRDPLTYAIAAEVSQETGLPVERVWRALQADGIELHRSDRGLAVLGTLRGDRAGISEQDFRKHAQRAARPDGLFDVQDWTPENVMANVDRVINADNPRLRLTDTVTTSLVSMRNGLGRAAWELRPDLQQAFNHRMTQATSHGFPAELQPGRALTHQQFYQRQPLEVDAVGAPATPQHGREV